MSVANPTVVQLLATVPSTTTSAPLSASPCARELAATNRGTRASPVTCANRNPAPSNPAAMASNARAHHGHRGVSRCAARRTMSAIAPLPAAAAPNNIAHAIGAAHAARATHAYALPSAHAAPIHTNTATTHVAIGTSGCGLHASARSRNVGVRPPSASGVVSSPACMWNHPASRAANLHVKNARHRRRACFTEIS